MNTTDSLIKAFEDCSLGAEMQAADDTSQRASSPASLRGRSLDKEGGKETGERISAQKILVPAAMLPTCIPPAFKERFGLIGEALADALPFFALDVVGLVAQYAVCEVDQKQADDFLLPAIRRFAAYRGSVPFVLRAPEFANYQNIGPNLRSLAIEINPVNRVTLNDVLKIFIIPHCPNLQSLAISHGGNMSSCLHLLKQLQHLKLDHFGKNRQNIEKFLQSISQLDLRTLHMPSRMTPYLACMPTFGQLSELSFGVGFNPSEKELGDFIEFLKRHKTLKRLKLPTYAFQQLNASTFKDSSLEVICFEDVCHYTLQRFPFLTPGEHYPPSLRVVIFKDCDGITEADCENFRRKSNYQVLSIDSAKERDNGVSSLKPFFHFEWPWDPKKKKPVPELLFLL